MRPRKTIHALFLNENTLGHGSYLPRFIAELEKRPELGVAATRLDAVPLPPRLQARADRTLRGLRRFGLDFHAARWRRIVSAHARQSVEEAARARRPDVIVVNTQSVALELSRLSEQFPLVVCLDATFAQLKRSRWFAMNQIAAWFTPLTLAPILPPERRLFRAARQLLPWSAMARDSLIADYELPRDKIRVLPPSLDTAIYQRVAAPPKPKPKREILFVGGDFQRKGGPALLEAHQQGLAETFDLHIVTESDVPSRPGVFVHHNVRAGADAWRERWQKADVFVFPSGLETFGIVLLEAMAFGVPVVSSRAGAAEDILENGGNGLLLDSVTPDNIIRAVRAISDNPADARSRVQRGRARVERDFDLATNTEALAAILHAAAE